MSCDVTFFDVTLSRFLSQCMANFPTLLIEKKRNNEMDLEEKSSLQHFSLVKGAL